MLVSARICVPELIAGRPGIFGVGLRLNTVDVLMPVVGGLLFILFGS